MDVPLIWTVLIVERLEFVIAAVEGGRGNLNSEKFGMDRGCSQIVAQITDHEFAMHALGSILEFVLSRQPYIKYTPRHSG